MRHRSHQDGAQVSWDAQCAGVTFPAETDEEEPLSPGITGVAEVTDCLDVRPCTLKNTGGAVERVALDTEEHAELGKFMITRSQTEECIDVTKEIEQQHMPHMIRANIAPKPKELGEHSCMKIACRPCC